MSDTPPEVKVSPARKVFLSGASIIWIIPILALVVALGVAWKSYNEKGPLIVLEFEKGTGIKAGETELKYRDITVGKVEKVGFTAGLGKVTAAVRLAKDVAPYVDSSAVFWIVQPEVTAQGITGLSTVLSGVHIEGSWDDQIGSPAFRFQAALEPPLIQTDKGGLEIAFRTTANGQLTDNAPILYKGIEVGRVGRAKIDPRGGYAVVEALIYEEHRVLVNESTRFWDASGFSVNISPAGAEINFSSLATLVGGGITFDTFVSGGGRVADGTVFQIFPDEETARNSVFNASEVEPLKISVIFDDNISGLTVGAPVELSGLKIGKVDTLSGIVDYDHFGDSRVRLNVILSIQPARLGLPGAVTAANALSFLTDRVEAGLRARLASASLLTGGLKVEMVMVEDAPAAGMTAIETGFPQMPTTKSDVSDAAATVEGVFTRINNLPIEDLLNSAVSFLNAAEALVADEDLRETPQDVRLLLSDIRGLVASEDVRNIPVAMNATLSRIEGLVAELEEEQIAARLVSAIDTVVGAAASVSTSVEGVPELLEDLRAVAQKAEALKVDELMTEVTALVATAEHVIGSEAAAELPASLKEAVDQVNTTLSELRAAGTVSAISKTLAATQRAATNVATTTEELPQIVARLNKVLDDASATAATINSTAEGVPALLEGFQAIAAKAEALNVEDLLAELTDLTQSADALINSDDTKALPASLRQAVDQINTTVAELRAAGAVTAITDTLTSTRLAAANIATTTDNLPQLTARLNKVLDDAAAAAATISTSAEGVPALLDRIQAIADKADALNVEDLLAELTDLTQSADALINSDDTKALPASLRQAVDQINTTVAELRAAGAVTAITDTLASTRLAAANIAITTDNLPQMTARLNKALDDAAAAAASISSSAEGVPALLDRIQAIADKAESLDVEELLRELTKLTTSADALIGTEDAQALPRSLKRALDEVNFTLQELREAGAVDNVNRTLASARNAADSIAGSVQNLPQMIERLNRLIAQTGRTIEGYNKGDELNRSAQETLRDIQKAADALASLARTIERNPNSLLLGR